jgi:hypothetical protein
MLRQNVARASPPALAQEQLPNHTVYTLASIHPALPTHPK